MTELGCHSRHSLWGIYLDLFPPPPFLVQSPTGLHRTVAASADHVRKPSRGNALWWAESRLSFKVKGEATSVGIGGGILARFSTGEGDVSHQAMFLLIDKPHIHREYTGTRTCRSALRLPRVVSSIVFKTFAA